MFPRRGVLVQLLNQGERLAEESLHAAIAAEDAFLEPLSARQRDSVAAAPKRSCCAPIPVERPAGPYRVGAKTERRSALFEMPARTTSERSESG
jgi:hypothetical protein